MKQDRRLILLELNEINFDIVSQYINNGKKLDGFKKIIDDGLLQTTSENDYELLEPWIQWPSVHTGMKFKDHNIFRLGDITKSDHDQIFEKVESLGFKVGAVSPMNASNKLNDPSYFIPDPWTETNPDNSFLSKSIYEAIVQAVNDNSSSKLTLKTILNLCVAFVFLVNPIRWINMAFYAASSIRKSWRKAIFLDKLLFEIHLTLFKKKRPEFSTLFLNAGAHIQHHYFLNSPHINFKGIKNPEWFIEKNKDPLLDVLYEYDKMICSLLDLKDIEIIIATGLSQTPFEETKFYYRLKKHKEFLSLFNIEYKDIFPRMTRDFLITFSSSEEALKAQKDLEQFKVDDGSSLFGEIDNRGEDLFVVLTYPKMIDNKTLVSFKNKQLSLLDHVAFVSLKNGEHCPIGYSYFSDGLKDFAPSSKSHVSEIHFSILNYFNDPILKSK